MCVGVTLWFGWSGVVPHHPSQTVLQPAYGYHTTPAKPCFSLHPDTTPPQPNHNVTPTHIEPEQYNP